MALLSIDKLENKFHRNFKDLISLDHTFLKHIEASDKVTQYLGSVELHSFVVLETRGQGELGPTIVVETDSKLRFAMRVLHKAKAIRNKMVGGVRTLKVVGEQVMHNLVSKQYRTYSDSQNFYFVSQLIEG